MPSPSFHQHAGIDYSGTCSPVAKPATIYAILSLTVQYNWPISQLDVSNAFHYGHFSKDIFMAQPPSFIDSQKPHHVCKLHKSLYGLKYKELVQSLLSLGFITSAADHSLFVKFGEFGTYLLVYVDDIIITSNSLAYC